MKIGRSTIIVSKAPLSISECVMIHRIRTISAKAAGRKFQREIYPSICTKIDMDDYHGYESAWAEDLEKESETELKYHKAESKKIPIEIRR
jgi:hypothetical protein